VLGEGESMRWRIVPIDGNREYNQEIVAYAQDAALKAALEVRSELVDCDIEYIKKLGPKWEARFLSAYNALHRKFSNKVDDLILLSDRVDIYTTQYEASLRFKWVELSGSDVEQSSDELTTFNVCENKFACGVLLAQHYNSACRAELLHDMPVNSFPYIGDVLEAVSVNRLMQAALCITDSPQKALNLLADSVSALHLSTQGEMLRESFFARKNDRKVIASKAANARLANDPKQKALKEIEKAYETVKNQFKRRGYSAEFVREMHIKYPVITEQKTIANLVAKLNKVNQHIPR
jgi:hypothetical protein